jgi:transposase
MSRKSYPSDVSDEEWEFVMPYLCLMVQEAPQRQHDLRDVFNALRWLVRSGAPWRYLPGDFPRWEAVYQQTQRWKRSAGFTHRCSRRWLMIFGRGFERPKVERLIQVRSSSTRALGKARPKAATERESMFIKPAEAQRFTRLLTPWGT